MSVGSASRQAYRRRMTRPVGGNFELWSWYFFRVSGVLLLVLAFGLGVVPLVIATGASSASQRAIGTGVLGGMITGTVLAVLFVPTFFVVVRKLFKGKIKTHNPPSTPAGKEALSHD